MVKEQVDRLCASILRAGESVAQQQEKTTEAMRQVSAKLDTISRQLEVLKVREVK